MDNDTWKQITENIRCPRLIADPANPDGPMIHQAALVMSAKSPTCLNIAATAVSYYEMIDHPLSAIIMMYDLRLKNFKVHMDAMKYMKKDDTSGPPKLYKTLAIEEYIESLDVYCESKIGAMMCLLACVIRENATVPDNSPEMEHNQLYST